MTKCIVGKDFIHNHTSVVALGVDTGQTCPGQCDLIEGSSYQNKVLPKYLFKIASTACCPGAQTVNWIKCSSVSM